MKTVLIHGMVMSPAFWSCLAPSIVREGRTAADPLPGHDPWRLDDLPQGLTTAAIVNAYAEAIERDFNGQPVTLIGHSTGGFVSLLLARHRPDLVSNVILMGAFACGRLRGRSGWHRESCVFPYLGGIFSSGCSPGGSQHARLFAGGHSNVCSTRPLAGKPRKLLRRWNRSESIY